MTYLSYSYHNLENPSDCIQVDGKSSNRCRLLAFFGYFKLQKLFCAGIKRNLIVIIKYAALGLRLNAMLCNRNMCQLCK